MHTNPELALPEKAAKVTGSSGDGTVADRAVRVGMAGRRLYHAQRSSSHRFVEKCICHQLYLPAHMGHRIRAAAHK